MRRSNQTKVILIVVFGLIIFLPLILALVFRSGDETVSVTGSRPSASSSFQETGLLNGNVSSGESSNPSTAPSGGFELEQAAKKANQLVEEGLADALRKGDVSLDFMSAIKSDLDEANTNRDRRRTKRALAGYEAVIFKVESTLEALGIADRARELSGKVYSDLERLAPLKAVFGNAYGEAVQNFNSGQEALSSNSFKEALDFFEVSDGILGDLEARSLKRASILAEAGQAALDSFDLEAARSAYSELLKISPESPEGTRGMTMVNALSGVQKELSEIRSLAQSSQFDLAISRLNGLLEDNPNNPFLLEELEKVRAEQQKSIFQSLVSQGESALQRNDPQGAIEHFNDALKIRPDSELQTRVANLKREIRDTKLERLLADGYQALETGQYERARDIYREAASFAPESKEAMAGRERASSLYLANIRYTQGLNSAAKQLQEGRFPLAADRFNEALKMRPSSVTPGQSLEESRIRTEIEAQNRKVDLIIKSDKKTYVSVVGVQPPDRFKEESFSLFPDVYKIRGTRPGYRPIEKEIKMDVRTGSQTITVECSEKL